MLLPLVALSLALTTPQQSIDLELANRYFQEAQWISDDDGGALWGVPLAGPLVFANPQTREAVASEDPSEPTFKNASGRFIGQLPPEIGIANYSFTWRGKTWTMVMWPLPTNRAERARLVAHELWHGIQNRLGLPASSPRNEQMDKFEGRLWLQIEVLALAKALSSSGAERANGMKDALLFRAARQEKFPGCKADEDALELNEGLAEWTGFMMRGGWEPESRLWLGNQLRSYKDQATYSRGFAYKTGAAYAFLLNLEEAIQKISPSWRKALKKGDSLAGLLGARIGYDPSIELDRAVTRAKAYGYDEILKSETKKEEVVKQLTAKYTVQFLEGPVLVLPMPKGNFTFDPNDVFPFGENGTVYTTSTVTDDWGSLTVTGGGLVAKDYSNVRVAAPKSELEAEGPGWSLKLNPGWRLVAGGRKGDFTVRKL